MFKAGLVLIDKTNLLAVYKFTKGKHDILRADYAIANSLFFDYG